MHNKKILAYVLLSPLFLPLSSVSAAVTFNFVYDDPSEFSAAAIADLETAANLVGSYFTETATINILTKGTVPNGSGALAGGSSLYANSNNAFSRGAVGFKIINGLSTDITSLGYDGTFSIDLQGYNWGYGSSIASGEYDFQATVIHELFHTVGFSSAIDEDGSSFSGTNAWTVFDQFVGDSQGSLIDLSSNNLDMDIARWDIASVGGAGDGGLEWLGANAIAANGGDAVYLYSSSNWADGTSGSHLDDQEYTNTVYLMEGLTGTGLGARTLSALEIGMLQDLGFDAVNTVPEPSNTSILALSAVGFLLRRRR